MEFSECPRANARSEFISNVISSLTRCHSHNIHGTSRRLDYLFQDFQSNCVFKTTLSIKFELFRERLKSTITHFRYIPAGRDVEYETVLRTCMTVVGSLGTLVDNMVLLSEVDRDAENPDLDTSKPVEHPERLAA